MPARPPQSVPTTRPQPSEAPTTPLLTPTPHAHASYVQAVSYVSRRRLDDADFDPDAVDEEGLPLVYNEQRIAAFWSGRPGELAGRCAGCSGPHRRHGAGRRFGQSSAAALVSPARTARGCLRCGGRPPLREHPSYLRPVRPGRRRIAQAPRISNPTPPLHPCSPMTPPPLPPTAPAPADPRWAKFAGISVPWLTKLANAFISGQLEARQALLARDAVDNLEQLGPTFLKLAQILSIRCEGVRVHGSAGVQGRGVVATCCSYAGACCMRRARAVARPAVGLLGPSAGWALHRGRCVVQLAPMRGGRQGPAGARGTFRACQDPFKQNPIMIMLRF
jgi:hypothetical protein